MIRLGSLQTYHNARDGAGWDKCIAGAGSASAFGGYTGKHGMIIEKYSQINRDQVTLDTPLNSALSLLSVLYFVSNLGPRMNYQPFDSCSSRFRIRYSSPVASLLNRLLEKRKGRCCFCQVTLPHATCFRLLSTRGRGHTRIRRHVRIISRF